MPDAVGLVDAAQVTQHDHLADTAVGAAQQRAVDDDTGARGGARPAASPCCAAPPRPPARARPPRPARRRSRCARSAPTTRAARRGRGSSAPRSPPGAPVSDPAESTGAGTPTHTASTSARSDAPPRQGRRRSPRRPAPAAGRRSRRSAPARSVRDASVRPRRSATVVTRWPCPASTPTTTAASARSSNRREGRPLRYSPTGTRVGELAHQPQLDEVVDGLDRRRARQPDGGERVARGEDVGIPGEAQQRVEARPPRDGRRPARDLAARKSGSLPVANRLPCAIMPVGAIDTRTKSTTRN